MKVTGRNLFPHVVRFTRGRFLRFFSLERVGWDTRLCRHDQYPEREPFPSWHTVSERTSPSRLASHIRPLNAPMNRRSSSQMSSSLCSGLVGSFKTQVFPVFEIQNGPDVRNFPIAIICKSTLSSAGYRKKTTYSP